MHKKKLEDSLRLEVDNAIYSLRRLFLKVEDSKQIK